jgi:hypothetical protein
VQEQRIHQVCRNPIVDYAGFLYRVRGGHGERLNMDIAIGERLEPRRP